MGLATSVMEAGKSAAATLAFAHNGIAVGSSVGESCKGCRYVYLLVLGARKLKGLHGSLRWSVGRSAEGEVGARAWGLEQEAILLCSFVRRWSLVCPFRLPTEKAVLSEPPLHPSLHTPPPAWLVYCHFCRLSYAMAPAPVRHKHTQTLSSRRCDH